MASLAFIPGVISLAIAQGAGAEMRPSFGTAVSFGVLRLTSFGLLLAWTF
jgi:hydrophobic/amphiphilic exporter-1 (mainly G- bacteria), HAE1 family